MDELTGDRLVASDSTHPDHVPALWAVTLVTDVQALSAGSRPYAQVAPQITRLRHMEAGQAVLESALPEIRCLATLLAAGRRDARAVRSPDHFTDDADWLAARAYLLGLTHVEVTLGQMGLLDQANRRLRELGARAGLARQTLLPVLCAACDAPAQPMALRGWGPLPPAGANQGGWLRQRCRSRLAALLSALAPRP
ncbi:hypothetical protein [Paludibacterium sp.]|uniref:hypothetical protein n=1 Tax=Paludibacterium sp. TaxID=1917523 RepID=UPI0025D366E0|nr:hypothetical protein [Paludibacterium sp.]MBV8646000.1 hypothetical protein [Paludibacterium sp.]